MISRLASQSAASRAARITRSRVQATTKRSMAGGGGYLKVSPVHQMWGEAFGVFCWLWVFHRARQDGAVVLGLRHPWDHVEDPWKVDGEVVHPDDEKDLQQDWDKFLSKAIVPGEDDDDDDDDDEEEDDDDEEEEDEDEDE